ncbi:MAG: kelch repeat-containing protein, partial [Gaiellaceae bacterium]
MSLTVPAFIGASTSAWEPGAALPLPRTEVAAAAVGAEIMVVGGYLADGSSARRADAYSARLNRWRRLPDLPVAVNHAMAAGYRGRLYVVGGYVARGEPLRAAYVL